MRGYAVSDIGLSCDPPTFFRVLIEVNPVRLALLHHHLIDPMSSCRIAPTPSMGTVTSMLPAFSNFKMSEKV